jgi:hypothetical protein
MAIMKTYSDEEIKVIKTSKKDGKKLLIQPERLNPEAFKRIGAQQNIDQEYVYMCCGLNEECFGRCDSPNIANK